MVKWVVVGFILGAILVYHGVGAAALPQVLLYGRTSGNVNVPMLVSTDGTLHTQ